ncbi:WD40-repeat-containing protein [Wickerhamomyces ciferrii]|uniref:WD40-repeat-containing protein n=1 Tax=Wickerhamomyces ciferrii (strain ATCC 14091 / BCRC 22168 / CBS 111 / JCM 3599 / NBRC 0793 / NRRL Y-1031 F-60-10) TaxID=1206466 RepID=K0KU91_WICCF|nr:WD40-repeat-containing protein [Wickerhamomyces ciferrii]CCH46746.1 WD40-repeat-containing protein [Wickerhamomyces ciferrii]
MNKFGNTLSKIDQKLLHIDSVILMANITSPYESVTFGNSLSLRVDGGVGAVSINPSGLYVVDLDDPFSPPRWFHHMTSWEVADVQWSPHSSKPSWVISTSNQKAMVWNLARSTSNAIEFVLHGHSRAITDINFHPDHPELLATCSVDTSVLAWDTRSPKRPFYTVSDWRAGASQVKWNFKNPNILSSSHDHYFYVWDLRNNAKPLLKINAHERKINGVDFSRTKESEIITCSNDHTVKFWDLSKDINNPVSTINTEFPVWRARHLPFGEGCSIMPLRGGNNSIYLSSKQDQQGDSKLKSCYIFKGHTDRITDFLWRQRHSSSEVDDRDFQLVTWSKDCDLRLWSMNDDIYEKVGFQKGEPKKLPTYTYKSYREEPGAYLNNGYAMKKTKDTFVSSKGETINSEAHLSWISGVRIGRSAFAPPIDQNPNVNIENLPDNLGEEVSVVGHKFPKVKFEKISVSTGTLVLSLNGPWGNTSEELVFLRIEIKYPKTYPSEPPTFRIEENRDLEQSKRQEILKTLNEIVKKYASVNRFSLESSLRYFMGEKIELDNLEKDDDDFSLQLEEFDDLSSIPSSASSSESEAEDEELMPLTHSGLMSAPLVDSTPIPKGCGACWTKTGELLCFFIPKQAKQQNIIKFDQKGFSNQMTLNNDDQYSDDSLSDDLNDVLKDDVKSRSKIPGVFRMQNYNNNHQNRAPSLPTERSGATQQNSVTKNIVAIFDFKHLIPTKLELAKEYRISGGTPCDLSAHNSEVCTKYGYTDLADSWRILSTIFSQNFHWGTHPFGKSWLIKELMDYYERLGDVQMLAMLSCVIYGSRFQNNDQFAMSTIETSSVNKENRSLSIHSYNDTNSIYNYSESAFRLPFSRSSSVLAKEPEKPISIKIEMMNEAELGFAEESFNYNSIEDETFDEPRFTRYREQYANILYTWELPFSRVEILKFNQNINESDIDIYRSKIRWLKKAVKCCNYCGLEVRRRLFTCYKCGHVLHADCATEWWNDSNECPTGCGCSCIDE